MYQPKIKYQLHSVAAYIFFFFPHYRVYIVGSQDPVEIKLLQTWLVNRIPRFCRDWIVQTLKYKFKMTHCTFKTSFLEIMIKVVACKSLKTSGQTICFSESVSK